MYPYWRKARSFSLSAPTHNNSIYITHTSRFLPFFIIILWIIPKADYMRSAWYTPPHCHSTYSFLITLSLSSQSQPQHNVSVSLASSTQCLIPLGCSHLLQHLSPGPTASPCVLLVPHSTYAWCGSASAHQQLVSWRLRKSRLSLFSIHRHCSHTL